MTIFLSGNFRRPSSSAPDETRLFDTVTLRSTEAERIHS